MLPLDTLLGVYLVLQGLDYWTTIRAISNGGVEANPVVAKLMDKFGLKLGLGIAKVAGVAAGVVLYYYQQSEILVMLCIGYAYVVWGNFRVIRNTSR